MNNRDDTLAYVKFKLIRRENSLKIKARARIWFSGYRSYNNVATFIDSYKLRNNKDKNNEYEIVSYQIGHVTYNTKMLPTKKYATFYIISKNEKDNDEDPYKDRKKKIREKLFPKEEQ